MTDLIEDFLAGLESDRPKPFEGKDRISKILMSSQDNQGTVMFAPILNADNKFYSAIDGVREFNMPTSIYGEGKIPVWVKILPKALYGQLSSEDSALYDEVSGLFDQVDEAYKDLDAKQKYGFIRWRRYSIFQGMLLKHTNRSQAPITDNVGKAVLLIFPSLQPIEAMANAITTKSNSVGNKSWIAPIFAPLGAVRQGAMVISFSKPDKPGYDCSASFEFNSSFSTVIDSTTPISKEVEDLCQHPLRDWLAWQTGEKQLFNPVLFKEVKSTLIAELNKKSAGTPAPEPSVPNQNGIDPMVGTPAPSPAPSAQTFPEQPGKALPF